MWFETRVLHTQIRQSFSQQPLCRSCGPQCDSSASTSEESGKAVTLLVGRPESYSDSESVIRPVRYWGSEIVSRGVRFPTATARVRGFPQPDSLTATRSRKKTTTKLRSWVVNQLTWEVGRVRPIGTKLQTQRLIHLCK